ncbi:MAG: TolC family protein [Candidatus Coatesbacteria bacterium]|nr:TolC family protein [Candidatus Coatesbacteria bacterium]
MFCNKLIIALIVLSTVSTLLSIELSVDEAVEIGIKNSLELETLRTKLKQSKVDIDLAKSTVFPVISGQLSYTRLNEAPSFDLPAGAFGQTPTGLLPPVDVHIPMGDENNYKATLTATQPLFLGGRDWTAIKLSKIYTSIVDDQIISEELKIRLKIKEVFYQALLAEKMTALMESSYDNALQHLEQVQSLRTGGAITSYDLLRARVQVNNLKPQVQNIRSGADLAKRALLVLLRLPADQPLKLKGDFPHNPKDNPVPSLEECINTAKKDRAEIKQLDKQIKILEGAVSIQKAGHYPSLFAVGNFNYSAYDFNFKKDTWTNDWNVSLVMSIPIFSGFKVVAETKKARYDLDQAELGKKQLIDGIELQVRSYHNALLVAAENLKGLFSTIQEAEMGVEIATSRYKTGASTQVEYFDSELALEKSKTLYLQGLYDYTIAWLRLNYAMGKKI